MKIRLAMLEDASSIQRLDKHLPTDKLQEKIQAEQVLVGETDKAIVAVLRFGFFWDEIPFLNLLYVQESDHKKGYGTQLMIYWENKMKEQGYHQVLTSTLSNEQAQFFYRKLGYEDCGSLRLPKEATEIIFRKEV